MLKAIVRNNTDVFPIDATAKQITRWLKLFGVDCDVSLSIADMDKNGELDSHDAYSALSKAAGIAAAPVLATGPKKCMLNVSDYDDGKLDLTIDLNDASGVYSADIVMKYDPNSLAVADVSQSSATSEWLFADAAESGELRISMAGASQPAADGSLITVSIDAASVDAIRQLEITEVRLNGGRSKAEIENLPKAFAMMQNYPNPFNPETWIPYQLSMPANVTVSIYSVNGQMIRQLELGNKMPGSYVDKARAAYWDGRNESGEKVSSGVYFYQLRAGQDASVGKMIVVK
jgi:hypothetical protein